MLFFQLFFKYYNDFFVYPFVEGNFTEALYFKVVFELYPREIKVVIPEEMPPPEIANRRA